MKKSNTFGNSLLCAVRGLRHIIRHERNFQIQLFFAEIAIACMIVFKVQEIEALILLLVIMSVLLAEITNTIIEKMIDIIKPGNHPYARIVKDLAAGGVLVTAITAFAVGMIVFLPRFYDLYLLIIKIGL